MSLRRIDLFEVMDAYEDEEFEPKEGCFVDKDQVKETVLARVGQKKRRGRKMVVLAAALAACLALVGWSYGERIYHFLSGGQVTIGGSGGIGSGTVTMSDGLDEEGNPAIIALEGDRLWYLAGGEPLDVTDRVDDNTPYVETSVDGEGNLHYVIVGGTPEDYGWYEGIKLPDGSGGGSGMPHSRTDLSTEEQLRRPAWLEKGETQVRELWQEMKSEEK